MDKNSRKKTEKLVTESVANILSGIHKIASGKFSKNLKSYSKDLIKKFSKEMKKAEKKVKKPLAKKAVAKKPGRPAGVKKKKKN